VQRQGEQQHRACCRPWNVTLGGRARIGHGRAPVLCSPVTPSLAAARSDHAHACARAVCRGVCPPSPRARRKGHGLCKPSYTLPPRPPQPTRPSRKHDDTDNVSVHDHVHVVVGMCARMHSCAYHAVVYTYRPRTWSTCVSGQSGGTWRIPGAKTTGRQGGRR